MSFNANDLLNDLSDDSDSFFEDPKVLAKKASLTKTPERKITDIFNLDDERPEPKKEEPKKRNDDWLGLDPKEDAVIPDRTPQPNPARRISFSNDDDIFGDLGLAKKTPEARPTPKKIDALESILRPPKAEEKPPETSRKIDDILNVIGSGGNSNQKRSVVEEKVLKSPQKSTMFEPSERRSEGRRGRSRPFNLEDPLGLFSTPSQDSDTKPGPAEMQKEFRESSALEPPISKPTQTQSTPNISEKGLPDWLGGTAVKSTRSETALKSFGEQSTRPEPRKEPEENPTSTLHPDPGDTEKFLSVETQESVQSLSTMLTQQKLAQSQVEFQNTAMSLQQQESHLLMALHLKKYEDALSHMQLKQQDVLSKQEQHFNLLLERQFAKQQAMESSMRLQQERINNHIQLLISQPAGTTTRSEGEEEFDGVLKTAASDNEKMYENIISSLKQRQNEEIFLLEESYKKQITLLEQSLEAVEDRLRSNLEKMTQTFEQKLSASDKSHEGEVLKYQQKLQEAETRHANEVEQIRSRHAKAIEEMKSEHSSVIENIQLYKKSETSLFSESSAYAQKLDTNIEVLYSNSKALQEIRDNMEKDHGFLAKVREDTLKSKEQEISLLKTALEKSRESVEEERVQMLGMLKSLEQKLAEQNQSAKEERWAFQQATATLAARASALDRESDFNRACIERERKQLETLRESILAEQEKIILQLTEEKLAVSAEKSRLETSSKLTVNYDSQRAKAEADAVIQVAKEAMEMTDKERQLLQQEKCEVEKLKRALRDKERQLKIREDELETLMRDAERKISESENELKESKRSESRYNERLKDLQNQLVVLSIKEKKLAEEKMVLSRQRLAMQTMARQNRNCALCSADMKKLDDGELKGNFPYSYLPKYDEDNNNETFRLHLEVADEELSLHHKFDE